MTVQGFRMQGGNIFYGLDYCRGLLEIVDDFGKRDKEWQSCLFANRDVVPIGEENRGAQEVLIAHEAYFR